MIWFCYGLAFSMTMFAIVLLFLLRANTRLYGHVSYCKMELEALNEAVQHLWRENDKRK